MPIIGATISSVAIDATNKILTVTGTNFGSVEYPVSDIKCRTGSDPYVSVDSVDSWANLEVVGSYSSELSAGTYDVQVVTSNNETVTKTSAFVVAAAGGAATIRAGKCPIATGVMIGV